MNVQNHQAAGKNIYKYLSRCRVCEQLKEGAKQVQIGLQNEENAQEGWN